MKIKRLLIVGAVIAGIAWAVCVIWTIYDSVNGGPAKWYYLVPVTMSAISCVVVLYQYLKDEKSKK